VPVGKGSGAERCSDALAVRDYAAMSDPHRNSQFHRQLAERYGDVPVKTRHAFLRGYTNAPAYRRLLITGAPRIDLGGLVVGRVTEAESPQARERLLLKEAVPLDGDMPCAG
jgi:ProQ/FINO family